jgi:hypothetical protein
VVSLAERNSNEAVVALVVLSGGVWSQAVGFVFMRLSGIWLLLLHCITNQRTEKQTSRNRVIAGKFIVAQLVRKLFVLHGIRKFITMFITARQSTLCWAIWIQSVSSNPISLRIVLILFSYLRLGLPVCLFTLRTNQKLGLFVIVSLYFDKYSPYKEILHIKFKLWICVCMLAYSSRTDKSICTKFGMLIFWNQEEVLERPILRKSGFETRWRRFLQLGN